jgi:hypothetical protein
MHSIVDAIFEKVSGERAAWRALRWIMAYYLQRSAMGAVALTALETRIASPRSGLGEKPARAWKALIALAVGMVRFRSRL